MVDFDFVWDRIVRHSGETFYTFTGISFQYNVVGNQLFPMHISGAVPRSAFEKAFELKRIESVAQLRRHNVEMPSYVYAILTDKKIHYMPTHPVEEPAKSDRMENLFKVGERVKHPAFGFGIIESVTMLPCDAMLTILFEGIGRKRIMRRLGRLEKV